LVYWQLVTAAFVERTLAILSAPAETAALSRIVPPAQISAAVARNDARENTAGVVGPPLGGVLFGVARLAPFAVDAASYLVSLVTVLALRTPLAPEPVEKRTLLRQEVGEGVAFIWRNPFLLGTIAGAALFLAPAWNGAVVGFRIRVTPDRLQGRVHAVEALLSFGARPFAMLATGFLLDGLGGRATLGLIAAYTIGIALLSTASPALRQMPPPEETGAVREPLAATSRAPGRRQ